MGSAIIPRTSPCALCPRLCGARRTEGERGFCGAADRLVVGRAALHFWEEPPISGQTGSGTVFFSHCPLQCVYCQNRLLAAGEAGMEIGVERLAQIFIELEGQGALNINLVTPTHFTPWIREAILEARQQGLGLPVIWNTSGYERVETLQALEGVVDGYLTDFKYARPSMASRYSHAPDYPDVALEAVGEMLRQTGPARFDRFHGQERLVRGTVVRHLLLPGGLEDSKEALMLLFECFGNEVLYSLMNQYTPVMDEAAARRFPELAQKPAEEDYEELLDYADGLGMEDYFWQDGPAASESFIPVWDGLGVLASAR